MLCYNSVNVMYVINGLIGGVVFEYSIRPCGIGRPMREGRSTMLSRGLKAKEGRNQAKRTNEIEHQRVPHKLLGLTQWERRWSCTLRDVKHQNIVIPETSTDLEIQGVSIFWGEHKLNIFKMHHPPNQGCLPDSFLDLATANVSSIFIGDLNAKHYLLGMFCK
ncbi:hypothetical protein TNCV_4322891 [Trichonephila clavipes]|nr:hypothetical protein TNCV_4322891 [Trichonephila clavipes]